MEKFKYIIIGNSAAAIGAIEGIRQSDKDNTILVVSEEPLLAYSRPLISYYLFDETIEKRINFRNEQFYQNKNVKVLLSTKAVEIDFEKKQVRLNTADAIEYEKLLIATGGKPIIPEIRGSKKPGVMTFTTFADAQKLRKGIVGKNKKVVIIGGGLIGLKVAEGLVEAGVKVTVVELAQHCLAPVLDETSAKIVEDMFLTKGVEIFTGHTIKEIKGEKKVGLVILDNNKKLSVDYVIIAIGVRPRLELVEGKNLKTNKGIVVDNYMKTSAKDVYSAGDVAEVFDFILENNRLLMIWPNAYYGGRIAGTNMAGGDKTYTWATNMNAADFFGLATISAGLIRLPEDKKSEYETIVQHIPARKIYKKFILKDDVIQGMIMITEIEPSGTILGLMRDKIKTAGFKDKLTLPDFGLVYLPEDVRKAKVNKQ